MYACGLREYHAPRTHVHFVLPETLCAFRGRIDAALRDELLAIQAAAAMAEGLGSPAPLVIETFPCEPGSQRGTDATILYTAQKTPLALIADITQTGSRRATVLTRQPQARQQELKKVMRCFGRQCRGPGHVLVQLGRHTAQQLLALGEPMPALGQHAQQRLAQAPTLSDAQRQRVAEAFTAALRSHARLRTPSTRLTPGQKLRHSTLVHADALTIAPILTGKSHGPAPFGRQPGIMSAPATGFIFAHRVPAGHPSDPSDGLPLLDTVHSAIERVQTTPQFRVHSVAGDLGIHDAALRQALHARGMLTVGIPKSVQPIATHPRAEEVRDSLNAAGLPRKRTPYQVQLACACGSSRPVGESHLASFLSRGAGQVRDKGHPGAVRQQGRTVRAHNGATLVRIRPQHLSKRAQKFRRLLGLRHRKAKEINNPKN